jgi:hypothetical protein
MLDERARELLDYAGPNDLVLMYERKSRLAATAHP